MLNLGKKKGGGLIKTKAQLVNNILKLPAGKLNGRDVCFLPCTCLFSFARCGAVPELNNWGVFALFLLQLLELCTP